MSTITWQENVLGTDPVVDRLHLGEGVEGIGGVPLRTASTPRSAGGAWGGPQVPEARRINAACIFNAAPADGGGWDWSPLRRLADSMEPRFHPKDELPLYLDGFHLPEPAVVFARPAAEVDWLANDAAEQGSAGFDVAWSCSDPTIYRAARVEQVWSTAAAGARSFTALNPSRVTGRFPRTLDFRFAPATPVSNPSIRVEHSSGKSWQIRWLVNMKVPQVLTVDVHRRQAIGTLAASGRAQYRRDGGAWVDAPAWPLWIPGTSTVTVSAASGTWTGHVKIWMPV